MSEKSSFWFHKHVELFEGLKKRSMFVKWKPKSFSSMNQFLELLSAFCWVQMVLWGELCCVFLFVFIFMKGGFIGKLFCICYATYMYNDRKAAENGSYGQGSEYIRTLRWYRNFANYFPASLVKTAELPATKNYLFGMYPHGVISVGAFCNFATSSTNFRELFPGIRSKVCTLNYHFFIPFYRELVMNWGMITCTQKSITAALTKSNNKLAVCNYDGYTSNAVVLVVGGAQEALYARPGNYRLVLNKRKGFIKIAIQTGAALVPVFTFGEIDILDQPSNEPGSKMRAYQEFVKKYTGISPLFAYGRGFFSNSIGMIPYRHPLTTVIGAPIDVTQNPQPTREEVDALHAKFIKALNKLFNDHKAKYVKNAENVKLIIE